MSDQTFKCEGCGGTGQLSGLKHRITMPGDYCAVCAANEKCAACGEIYPVAFTDFKIDVQNVICEDCAHDYQSVREFIKPIYSLRKKAA